MTSGNTATMDGFRGDADARPWIAVATLLLFVGLAAFVVSPKLGIATLGLFAAPLFVTAPRYALLLFVAMLPFDAVSVLGDAESAFSLTRIVGLALFGGWVIHTMVERRRVRMTRGAWHLVAYVGFACLSVVWAADPSSTLRALATLIQLLLLSVMAASVLREPDDVRRTIDVLLVSTLVVALLVLWEVPAAGKRASLELAGRSVNPNYLAGLLVFPAVAAFGLGISKGVLGWWRLAAVVPIAVALFLTGSRGGGIAFVGGILLIAALRRRIGVGVVVAAIGAILLLPYVAPQATVDRLIARYSTAEEDGMSGRMDVWRVAFAMAQDRPLEGTSYGAFSDSFYRYMLTTSVDPRFARAHSRGNRASHSIYIGTLAELGITGLLLLVTALWAHCRGLWRARLVALRRRDQANGRITLALLGVFAALVLFGATLDVLATKAPWMWLAMMQAATAFAAPVRRVGAASVPRAPVVPPRPQTRPQTRPQERRRA
jgi:O-antigen ligase